MRPMRRESDPQRLAGTEQLRLTDHVFDGARAQAFGERDGRGIVASTATWRSARRYRYHGTEQIDGRPQREFDAELWVAGDGDAHASSQQTPRARRAGFLEGDVISPGQRSILAHVDAMA